MENFHCEYLTDDQMKQLNPIIRNAICTALHTFQHYRESPREKRFMEVHLMSIPAYWESPALLDDYLKMWDENPKMT